MILGEATQQFASPGEALEVPGHSPDARHIYEKQGFVAIKEPTAAEAKRDTVWGGLTEMEKKLD